MITTIAKISALSYAGLMTIFELLSGADSADGLKGVLSNASNVLPWLLVWAAILIAWRNSKIGGALFLILALASVSFFHTYEEPIPFLLISFPLIVIGILFLAKK